MRREILSVRNLGKVHNKYILNNVSVMVLEGEILGIVGKHGSGVSMLMKIFQGKEVYDTGKMIVDGRKVRFSSVNDANRVGIFKIERDELLIKNLSVAENICITYPSIMDGLSSTVSMEAKAREILNRYEINIDVRKKVYMLSTYEKEVISIIKAVVHQARVLIMNDNMYNYHSRDRIEIKRIIKKLAAEKISVILTGMQTDNIIEIAERIVIINSGRVSGNFLAAVFDKELMNRMVTHYVPAKKKIYSKRIGEQPFLQLRSVVIDEVVFPDTDIYAGEMVSFRYQNGNPDKLLLYALAGLVPYTGEIYIAGKKCEIRNVPDSRKQKIALLRRYDAPEMLIDVLSIKDNLLLMRPEIYSEAGVVNRRMLNFACRELIKDYAIPNEILDFLPNQLNAHVRNEAVLMCVDALSPMVLLLDDSFLGQDEEMKAATIRFIEKCISKGACVIVEITAEDEASILDIRYIDIENDKAV